LEAFKDLAVLGLLVYMARRKIQMGHIMLVTALFFGVLHQVSILKLGRLIFATLLDMSTLTVFAALYLINVMEQIMRYSGSQNRLVTSLKNISGDPRFALAALPGIIGLLPSPGGARFSAPLVEEAAQDMEIEPEQKAAINYWFRHIWEYCLPLYPANLLAAEILKIPIGKFIVFLLPYSLLTIVTGSLFFKNMEVRKKEENQELKKEAWRQFPEGVMPVVAIMVLVLAFKVQVILALFLVTVSMALFYRLPWATFLPMLRESLSPRLFYMVFGALYFRDVLLQSGSIDQLLNYFAVLGLSPMLVAIIFPFTIGLLTGQTLPGLSITLPMLVAMNPANLLPLGSLAFISNSMGTMVSPMHLCLVMSLEHFNADFARTYNKLILPSALIMLFGLAYYYVW
jgi:hypothetical protein